MRFDTVNLFLTLLLALLLAANATALEVRSSADNAYISSTEASVFVYAKNPFNDTASVQFSASSPRLNAWFEPYTTILRKGSSAGAELRVSAPDCFRGDEIVTVYAQACSGEECETASKRIRVSVEPARACSSYIEGFAPRENYVPYTTCGPAGCFLVEPRPQSKVTKTASFDPISYDVRLSGGDKCVSFTRGEVGSTELSVRNRGASGSFDVRVVGPDSQLQAYASRDYISLQRGGVENFRVYAKAEPDAEEGRHFVTVQLLHRADVVAEKDLCIEIKDDHEVVVRAPSSAEINPERETAMQIEVENLGTIKESYSITLIGVPAGVEVQPQGFSLEPGEARTVDVVFSEGALKAEKSELAIIAEGRFSEARAKVMLSKKVVQPVPSISSGGAKEEQGIFKYSVVVKNEQGFDLQNVSFEVQGLPSGWQYTVPDAVDIPAGKQVVSEVVIRPSSDEEAEPALLVKQGEKVIGSQQLPKVKGAAAGLTGFLTLAFSQNTLFIIILLLLALVVILMVARIRREVQAAEGETKLEKLAHEVEGKHEDREFHEDFSEKLQKLKEEAGK